MNITIAEQIYQTFLTLIENGIYFRISPEVLYCIRSKELFDRAIHELAKDNLVDFFQLLAIPGTKLSFSINDNGIDHSIIETVRFPYNINFREWLIAFNEQKCKDTDILRICELFVENIPEIKKVVKQVTEKFYGTPKFNEYADKFSKVCEKILNNISSIPVKAINKMTGWHTQQIVYEYEFTEYLTYNQKRKLHDKFMERLDEYYQRCNSSWSVFYMKGLRIKWNDYSRKTTSCNKLILAIDSNCWNVIGQDELVEYIHKPGEK